MPVVVVGSAVKFVPDPKMPHKKMKAKKNKKAASSSSSSNSAPAVDSDAELEALIKERKRKIKELELLTDKIYDHAGTKRARRDHMMDIVAVMLERMNASVRFNLKRHLDSLGANVTLYCDDDECKPTMELHIDAPNFGLSFVTVGDWYEARSPKWLIMFDISADPVSLGTDLDYAIEVLNTSKLVGETEFKTWLAIVKLFLGLDDYSTCPVTFEQMYKDLPIGCIIKGNGPGYDAMH